MVESYNHNFCPYCGEYDDGISTIKTLESGMMEFICYFCKTKSFIQIEK